MVVEIQILKLRGLVDLMVCEVEGKETCTDYPLTMKMMNRLLGTETLHSRCSSADILILIFCPMLTALITRNRSLFSNLQEKRHPDTFMYMYTNVFTMW